MSRILRWALCAWLAGAPVAHAAASPTLYAWLEQQHQPMRRYRTVLRQAVHDLSYDYRMPTLMLPIAMDVYTGYLAQVHEIERQVLYPAVQARMTPEQQRQLTFLDHEIDSEHDMIIRWQRETTKTGLIDALDYLEKMLNRHLVLQEQWVFPVLDKVSAKEQGEILKRLSAMELALLGRTGRQRYEAVLAYLEGEIVRISPLM